MVVTEKVEFSFRVDKTVVATFESVEATVVATPETVDLIRVQGSTTVIA